ncbi:ammonium transporter [Flammeovirga kamogawensis]|uniref:Ammonium transporter n=1 Tax=Flammeovirga kamogawensis TaxID=373891 RepID=A0ABX8H4F9_9BACT|nr:ammonium transporter [Flammeovirga kamogawensis]MBB6460417.1 Amt family ammonium transporter [Flammeovirga kamogawensis]QWG10222.1 ammonium transporter [Flammeovirga kamogawensis]
MVWRFILVFSGDGDFIGDLHRVFLSGMTADSLHGNIPEPLFAVYQMTFAIITPGLFIGAFAERMKLKAVVLFSALWLILVYAPVSHWVWGGGWLQQMGVIDLAGGITVHATAGIAALLLAIFIRPRLKFAHQKKSPSNIPMVMIGACMLWVGWFGFNAGSQLHANGAAGMTLLVTHLSAAAACMTWALLEWRKNGKPTLISIVTGMIAGLATVTPASGNIGPTGAVIIGVVAAIVCFNMVDIVKKKWKIDDALDAFAVHGVGGILGTLLVAVLGTEFFGGHGVTDVFNQLSIQVIALLSAVGWSAIMTFIIMKVCKMTVGFRVSPTEEKEGLDLTEEGEFI